ncbi:MAG TPA: class I adenylate-forming enzyme family protein [Solirubrobacterales bacterium]|nr:class I adenylate-forming enzyme family protein [Solirubrobacterales bacterium]
MGASSPSPFWWPEAPGPELTVAELLASRVALRGDATALIAPSLLAADAAGRGETTLTYAELRERALRMASVLRDAGVGPGDRVGILLDNDGAIEAQATYHASHLLGAINVPLNTRYVTRELEYVLGFIEPKAVVFATAHADRLAALSEALGDAALLEAGTAPPTLGRPLGELLAAASPLPDPAPLEPDQDADWLFTSGTTGNPKAVALTHRGSVACGYQSVGAWGLDPDSVYQSFAPFFTSTGCHSNPLACLAAGCAFVVEPEFDVVKTLDRIERHGTTSTFLINSVLTLILERRTPEELAAYDFSALRRVCYGAQPSSPAFYHQIQEEVGKAWGVELVNIYGLTEGGTTGIYLSDADHAEALGRIGPYGISIGRNGFREWVEWTVLREEDDEPAAPNEVGELCVKGPSTMSRYVGREEETARALRGGWLHTGDSALLDDDDFLFFVDRNKQMIRRGGLNISSAEVEGVLLEHPGVVEVAVVPMPNPVLGSDVRGVVVPADPPPDPAELIAFAAERLADYKVPTKIDFIAALPRNGMNRVMKGVLTGEGESLSS